MIDLSRPLAELTPPSAHRRRVRGAKMFALSIGAVVVAVPFVARLIDRTADSLHASPHPELLVLGWGVVALLWSTVAVHLARRVLRLPSGGGFAIAYDSLPGLLVPAWVVSIWAWSTGHHLLGAASAVLCVYHLSLTVPRAHEVRRPKWVKGAAQFELAVANVFVDNPTPGRSAESLIAAGPDVIVINESNPAFLEAFEQADGAHEYPYRLTDPTDDGEYAITVMSKLPFQEGTGFVAIGPMQAAEIRLRFDGSSLTVLAVHAFASLEQNGYVVWEAQMQALREHLAERPERVVVAGDFNTTHYRPEFMELLSTGARDAHDTLGRGWSPSIKLSATGVLSSLGPIARLDHAVFTDGLWPTHIRNLPAKGSDHHPFVVSLAVRPTAEADAAPRVRRGTIDPSNG